MKAEIWKKNGVEVLIWNDDGSLLDSIRCDEAEAADLCRRINGFDGLKAACELVVSAFSEPDWGVDAMIVDKVSAALADAEK